jgi:hypothetical protein
MNIDCLFNQPLKLWLAAGVMSLLFITNLLGFFLVCRRLDEMERYLDKCSLVTFSKRFWGNSLRGRVVRLCAVMAAVTMPWWNIRRGVLDRQQVQDFPRGLKYLLRSMMFSGMFLLAVATADTAYEWLRH